jgi:hypothetical protein
MVTSSAPRPRNPETHAQLRREALRQIYIPLGVAVLALVVVMGLTIFMTGLPARSVWADVSLIYLSFFALAGGVVVLALVAGLVVGLWYVLRELPGYFKIAQDFMLLVSLRVAEYSQKVANLFITLRAYISAAQRSVESARALVTPRRKQ